MRDPEGRNGRDGRDLSSASAKMDMEAWTRGLLSRTFLFPLPFFFLLLRKVLTFFMLSSCLAHFRKAKKYHRCRPSRRSEPAKTWVASKTKRRSWKVFNAASTGLVGLEYQAVGCLCICRWCDRQPTHDSLQRMFLMMDEQDFGGTLQLAKAKHRRQAICVAVAGE